MTVPPSFEDVDLILAAEISVGKKLLAIPIFIGQHLYRKEVLNILHCSSKMVTRLGRPRNLSQWPETSHFFEGPAENWPVCVSCMYACMGSQPIRPCFAALFMVLLMEP